MPEEERRTEIQVSGPNRDPNLMNKLTASDVAAEGVHAAIQAVPFVGPAASAMLKLAIQSPSQKRAAEYFNHVNNDLRAVEDKLSILPDELFESGTYSSALISTTHIALLTKEPEKIDALRAAMLNIALNASDDEAFNQMRIAALRDMTSIHIKVLEFYSTRRTDVVAKIGKDNRAITPSDFETPLRARFRHDLPFYIVERACRELESAGLISVRPGFTKSLSGDNFATMLLTPFGAVLHGFITLPAEVSPLTPKEQDRSVYAKRPR